MSIPFHNSRLGQGQRRHGPSIDEGMLRGRLQAGEGFIHGAVCRLEDIYLINHRRIHHGNGRDDDGIGLNCLIQFLPHRFTELLGIIQAL